MTSPASRRLLTSRPVPGTARMWWYYDDLRGPCPSCGTRSRSRRSARGPTSPSSRSGLVESTSTIFASPSGSCTRDRSLAQPEEVLEVPVADVLGVVVAHRHHDVLALEAVQVPLRLLELPPVALHREVPGYHYEIRLQGVGLLDGGVEELGAEEPRAHVYVGDLDYAHSLCPPDGVLLRGIM